MYFISFDTPFGRMGLASEQDDAITRLYFPDERLPGAAEHETGLLAEGKRQLEAYFAGERTSFALSLRPRGTLFQQKVWRAIADIPYGRTRSYGQIAALLGIPGAARAVGGACRRNPIPVFIPCHRVVGADGGLTGFAGGLELKEKLLLLEREDAR